MTEDDKRTLCELMERISKGDNSARDILAVKYYRTVYCFIFNMIGSREDAKDLTQETFLRLCRHDFSVKVWRSGYVYLFQIAKNLCLDRFRKRKKDENIFMWEAERAERYIWDGPEDMNAIFSCLTESEERLVLLRYDGGYSVKEIARRTGIPTRTLDRRFTEIKTKIKESMKTAEETHNENKK